MLDDNLYLYSIIHINGIVRNGLDMICKKIQSTKGNIITLYKNKRIGKYISRSPTTKNIFLHYLHIFLLAASIESNGRGFEIKYHKKINRHYFIRCERGLAERLCKLWEEFKENRAEIKTNFDHAKFINSVSREFFSKGIPQYQTEAAIELNGEIYYIELLIRKVDEYNIIIVGNGCLNYSDIQKFFSLHFSLTNKNRSPFQNSLNYFSPSFINKP